MSRRPLALMLPIAALVSLACASTPAPDVAGGGASSPAPAVIERAVPPAGQETVGVGRVPAGGHGSTAETESGPVALELEITAMVDRLAPAAIDFLETIVEVNSGTMNPEGVREVGRLFETELAALGMQTRWIEMPSEVNRAGHLFAEIRGGDGPTILLIGHLDTVFEPDSPFQDWERLDTDLARGPGVSDMKGGDAVILLALQALHSAGRLDDLNVIVALLGDEEETGTPLTISRQHLVEAARRSDAALGFEGGVGGLQSATVARRGFTDWRLTVRGEQGHSSVIFNDRYGAGAAFEAARILTAFYDRLRGEDDLTFGAGILVGGTSVAYNGESNRGSAFGKTNVIPSEAVIAGDLRTLTHDQLARAKESMRQIVSENLPRTSAEIEFRDSYPPMAPEPRNLELLQELDRVSRDLGMGPITPVDPGKRGAADISFAAQYTAALGGLGVVGKGAHTPEETVDLSSIPVMAKRAAILISRLGGTNSD
ncbi:MAG: M20/M25/M40 family metallo-hydrolase [marine benthic group bacterium]|nr:M20/M25/M40 family metallo-hydrolase [Gemmatimonadota bacterium]